MLQEYYNLLDLNPGATTEDIKRAYRLKAKRYHPDANKAPEAHFQFIRIKEAFDVLLKIRLLEKYRISQRTPFCHQKDPYFNSGHYHQSHYNTGHPKHNQGNRKEEDDFFSRKFGRTLYLSVNLVFIIMGLLIFAGPLYTLLTRGFDPYNSHAGTIFAMAVVMAFGVIMVYKISISVYHFMKKD